LTVTLLDKNGNAAGTFTNVKAISYDADHDRFKLLYVDKYRDEYVTKIWAAGGSLKVEG